MRPTAALALALAVAVSLAGCTSSQDPTIDAGDTSAPEASTPSFTGAPVAPPVSTAAGDERAYLTGVEATAVPGGGSRVVFEFDPVVPGYVIDFVERPVTEDGSGDAVTVEGEALLSVRLENAAGARLEGDKAIPTYTGPPRVAPAGEAAVVTEVVDAGDFEGVVTWVVGLRRPVAQVAVSKLDGPSRLVIDVPPPTGG